MYVLHINDTMSLHESVTVTVKLSLDDHTAQLPDSAILPTDHRLTNPAPATITKEKDLVARTTCGIFSIWTQRNAIITLFFILFIHIYIAVCNEYEVRILRTGNIYFVVQLCILPQTPEIDPDRGTCIGPDLPNAANLMQNVNYPHHSHLSPHSHWQPLHLDLCFLIYCPVLSLINGHWFLQPCILQ